MTQYKLIDGKRVKLTEHEVEAVNQKEAEALSQARTRNLTAAEFQWLLGMNAALDDAWDALWSYCKANDRRAYATLRSQNASERFRIDVTLRLVTAFSAQLSAAGHNVSVDTVRTAWAETIEHFDQQHEQGD